MEIKVELKAIHQEYKKNDGSVLKVIDNVNLTFDKPSINMLLGPSGCGKSTLLRMVGGVRPFGVKTPTTGDVFIDGKICNEATDDAVMVFQQYSNRPDLTVEENVYFPFTLNLWKKKFSKKEAKERTSAILQSVGLADKANYHPSQLSGGQNQRVALARALVLKPRILLMDEPFGALDAQTRENMQELLCQLHKDNPCLILFVTHDVTEALALGDRVLIMSTHPATIADDFTISEPKVRSGAWLRSTEGTNLTERILSQLQNVHAASAKRGTVTMAV